MQHVLDTCNCNTCEKTHAPRARDGKSGNTFTVLPARQGELPCNFHRALRQLCRPRLDKMLCKVTVHVSHATPVRARKLMAMHLGRCQHARAMPCSMSWTHATATHARRYPLRARGGTSGNTFRILPARQGNLPCNFSRVCDKSASCLATTQKMLCKGKCRALRPCARQLLALGQFLAACLGHMQATCNHNTCEKTHAPRARDGKSGNTFTVLPAHQGDLPCNFHRALRQLCQLPGQALVKCSERCLNCALHLCARQLLTMHLGRF